MAKGNSGNLLQHFVALHAAARLQEAASPFDYVDLFAMGPWEAVERPSDEFRRLIGSLAGRAEGDLMASAFGRARQARYPEGAPGAEYPNTAALLLGLGVPMASMTVCELLPEKHAELDAYLAANGRGIPLTSHGRWQDAPLAKCAGPALVVLDPNQVHHERRSKSDDAGYLTIDAIRGVLGSSKLDVLQRAKSRTAAATIVTIFSYGEVDPDTTDRMLRAELEGKYGWQVACVRAKTVTSAGKKRDAWHQGWWCASKDTVAAPDLQSRWDAWSAATV